MSMFREKLCQDLVYIMTENTDFEKRKKMLAVNAYNYFLLYILNQ